MTQPLDGIRVLETLAVMEGRIPANENTFPLTAIHPIIIENEPPSIGPRTRYRATKTFVSTRLRKSKRKMAKASRRRNRSK